MLHKRSSVLMKGFLTLLLLLLMVSTAATGSISKFHIDGPIEAYQNDSVTFTITYDNTPVQARVLLQGQTTPVYSNISTGRITFTMPTVPAQGRFYTVTASLPNGEQATHTIFVKNTTSLLQLQPPSEPILENSSFTVTVTDGLHPISDATLLFNTITYHTNTTGQAIITAPDVLITTNYGIRVNKTGYLTNTSVLQIYEAGQGTQLMELIAPSILPPNQENIDIMVQGITTGIPNVLIELYYNDSKIQEYTTDATGTATISTPALTETNSCYLIFTKNRYQTFTGTTTHTITLINNSASENLVLTITPTEVTQGAPITFMVTDSSNQPIPDARIQYQDALLSTTDTAGILTTNAPYTPIDRECYFYAQKHGYNYAEETLTIRAQSPNNLYPTYERTVYENEEFSILIHDDTFYPIPTAQVTFNHHTQQTNDNGATVFTAPEVTFDKHYQIQIHKEGYRPTTASIKILDTTTANHTQKQLYIHAPPRIQENQLFNVTIRSIDNTPIANADVTFRDTTKKTNAIGIVSFTASEVNWDETYTIRTVKTGYTTATTTITIINQNAFSHGILALIVVIILAIGIIMYFTYNRRLY